jgi:hypothetical protein
MKASMLFCAALVVAILPGAAARAEDDDGARLLEDLRYLAQDATLVADTRGSYFTDRGLPTGGVASAQGAIRLEIAGAILDNWEVALTPEFNWSAESGIVGGEITLSERGRVRPVLGMAEAWVAWSDGPWTVKAGKQVFAWGNSDLLSLSDDLNASDKLDLPWAYKLGAPALAVSHATADLGVDLVVIPTFTPDRLPGLTSPWARSRAPVADAGFVQTGIRPDVVDGARDLPGGTDGVQVGLRATSSAMLEATDLSVSAFHGVSRTPVLLPRFVSPTVLALDSFYPRYTEFAMGFSTIVSDFEFHGEAAMHVTERSDEDDDYLSYVIGMRREWSDLGRDDIDTVRVTLEYAGEMITRHISDSSPYIRSNFDRTATNSVLGKLDLEFDVNTTLTVGGALNFEDGDYAVDAMLEHKLNDRVTLSAGFQMFAGPSQSFFGEWSNNDRAYVGLKMYW